MNKQQEKKQPFFARFMEAQIKDTPEVHGGQGSLKPSLSTSALRDKVTKPQFDMEHTMKYPSDGDEI